MAKPSWISLSRSEGTGGGSVNVIASENTGSAQRSGTLTIRTSSGLTKTVSVSQAFSSKMTINLNTILTFRSSGYKDSTIFTINALYSSGSVSGSEVWRKIAEATYSQNPSNTSVPLVGTCQLVTNDADIILKGLTIEARVTSTYSGSKFGTVSMSNLKFSKNGVLYEFQDLGYSLDFGSGIYANVSCYFKNDLTLTCDQGQSMVVDIDSPSAGITVL